LIAPPDDPVDDLEAIEGSPSPHPMTPLLGSRDRTIHGAVSIDRSNAMTFGVDGCDPKVFGGQAKAFRGILSTGDGDSSIDLWGSPCSSITMVKPAWDRRPIAQWVSPESLRGTPFLR
jgi:hypothetical protein